MFKTREQLESGTGGPALGSAALSHHQALPLEPASALLQLLPEIVEAADERRVWRGLTGLWRDSGDWIAARCRVLDLTHDLAVDIGSQRWFRGFAAMLGLSAAALSFWPNFTAVEAATALPADLAARDEFSSQMIMPLALGADIVVHSATKGIGGHADLLMGVAVAEPGIAEQLREQRYGYGATPGALEAFLALRGIRTLAVRLERAQANAQALAELLAESDHVTYVLYPGLRWHPGHELARRQMQGFGTIISFEVAGGVQAADRLCEATRVFANATSLGGVESLIEVRGNRESERAMGTPAALIRMSVGIEHVDDLLADLQQALKRAHSG